MGTIFEILSWSGKMPFARDRLTIWVSGAEIYSEMSFMIWIGILSAPVALLFFNDLQISISSTELVGSRRMDSSTLLPKNV